VLLQRYARCFWIQVWKQDVQGVQRDAYMHFALVGGAFQQPVAEQPGHGLARGGGTQPGHLGKVFPGHMGNWGNWGQIPIKSQHMDADHSWPQTVTPNSSLKRSANSRPRLSEGSGVRKCALRKLAHASSF
jgi:hypothetical protein